MNISLKSLLRFLHLNAKKSQSNVGNEEIRKCLDNTVFPFGADNEAIMSYHRVFVSRYAYSINFISHLPKAYKVLELAANPYGMTALLRYYLFDDLSLASFSKHNNSDIIELRVFDKTFKLNERIFNAEQESWPYMDQSFDAILCCEMVEHLAFDPMHVFAEANRVLKRNGVFFVSTPNASSLQNMLKLFNHKPLGLAPHYRIQSGLDSVYLRHSRELTMGALKVMFESAGFDIEKCDTSDSYPLDRMGMSSDIIK